MGVIVARAPGKVVLWGEYAVLAGAPALVMAVNRFARCEVQPDGADWRVTTHGFESAPSIFSRERLLGDHSPGPESNWAPLWHALRHLNHHHLPQGARVTLDTSGFQHDGRKLGLGSSAALIVAAYAALARLLDQTASLEGAMDVHRAFQGGSGSGLDVAAAWHGGLIRFQRREDGATVSGTRLPPGIGVRFVWSGQPARTRDHLARLEQWLRTSDRGPLQALCACSAGLLTAVDPLDALASYVGALHELDDAAGLGIYTEAHRLLERLAIEAGVVYKPCGAGGGDLGAAFCRDTLAADHFVTLVREHGFLPVSLETAAHGIQVTG
jgi:phosphomevalonate kinase